MELKYVAQKTLDRVAFVGSPCQVNTLRRMEVLGVVPSEAIKIHLGLFCAGNFQFGPEERRRLESIGNFKWAEVYKVNVKEELMIHLHNKEIRHIPLDQLSFMKRYACQFCDDYAAEFADLSFGGLGAPEGWTSVIVRSPKGQKLLADALRADLELFNYKQDPLLGRTTMAKVLEWSEKKKSSATEHSQELEKQAV
jgi:coenzyme F420 hydrogenase subunit beta